MASLDGLRRRFSITRPTVVQIPAREINWGKIETLAVSAPFQQPPGISEDFVLPAPQVREMTLSFVNWGKIETMAVSAPFQRPLDISQDFALPAPRVREMPVSFLISSTEVPASLSEAKFNIISLIQPVASPKALGTIFVRKEETELRLGQSRTRVRVEPQNLAQRTSQKTPNGLDIFELLLPILMPPASSEFKDELLFPQELYGFQRAGVKWLFENSNALLADDMGLGKTVEAITAVRALIRRSQALQVLIICPKSVLPNWMREMERWAPELLAIKIHGNQPTRQRAWHAYKGKCHVLVTTYEVIREDFETVRGQKFDLVIADEVQRIKNFETSTAHAVCGLSADRRWALTGTPLENRLEDIVNIFRFVKPGLFSSRDLFTLSTRLVRESVKPYVLRRRKDEALKDLPEKVVDTTLLELTEKQRQAYEKAENEGIVRLKSTSNVTVQHVLALIQYLKQICNFDPDSGESAKVDYLREDYLESACQNNDKTIIISQYVRTLEGLRERLKDYEPLIYSGQLSLEHRVQIEKLFQGHDNHKVLLLSLKAGGVGLNLTSANHVLHFDRWWNPAVECQAEDRTHRIGQTKTVFVTRLICQGTIEERIERLLEQKKILFREVVDELTDVNLERVLSEEELFGLFGLKPPRQQTIDSKVHQTLVERGKSEIKTIPRENQRLGVRPSEIKPSEPYSNLLRLRNILRSCEKYIWWVDNYFNARGLEELFLCLDPAVVRDVRILSGPARVDDKAKRDFERFRKELAPKGIYAEWRVSKGFAHDRFILGDNVCYLATSVDTILVGNYSQMLETPNRPPFELWWSSAMPLSDYKIEAKNRADNGRRP